MGVIGYGRNRESCLSATADEADILPLLGLLESLRHAQQLCESEATEFSDFDSFVRQDLKHSTERAFGAQAS